MSDFRATAEAAHRAGFTYFDQLGGRRVAGGIELWLRVLDPATFESTVIKGQFSTGDVLADLAGMSVADLWGGARWAELELRRAVPKGTLTPSGGLPHPEGPAE